MNDVVFNTNSIMKAKTRNERVGMWKLALESEISERTLSIGTKG